MTVFVGNISFDSTQESLADFFSQVGEVKDVRIPYGDTGKPRGFAHVEFADVETAQKALELHG